MTEPIHINQEQAFQIGQWRVEPESCRLISADNEVKLEPKVMQVLLCLAQMPGRVISREQLETTVWANTVVGYDAIASSIIKLRKALGDDSRHPRYIETIPKKGYRLVADIHIHQPSTKHETPASTIKTEDTGKPDTHQFRSIATVVLLLLLAISGYFFGSYTEKTDTDSTLPSIIVLPFNNLSNNPDQEYISEAITEDLITDLSKLASLRVIARQSAYHFKERQNFTIDDVVKELGVQYIVQGSTLKAHDHIRINVQVTDTSKKESIWAERFNVEQNDIFSVQDDITQQVIKALYIKPSQKESIIISKRPTINFEAYDAFLLGQKHFKNRGKQGFELAMQSYQRAIEIDPNYARAYGAMAVALTRGNRGRWIDLSYEEGKSRALALAQKAVSLSQTSPEVYWSLGFVHLYRKEFEEAEAAAKQAIKLSPNYADGYGLLAFISNWRGKPKQAERYILKAIDLNPYHTFDYPWNLGLAYYFQERYREAATQLNLALEHNVTILYPRLFLAASYVQLGEMDNAEWEIEQITATRNEATLSQLSIQLPFEHKEQLQSVIDILRKAGLPE